MLTEKELLRRLRVSRKTLYTWRLQGLPFRYGRGRYRYYYSLNDVFAWCTENQKDIPYIKF